MLQGQHQERCSVRERYRSVAGAGSGVRGKICDVEQGPESYQGRICDVARVSYADRVAGLLQGSDLLRYRDVAGGCLVAGNVRFPVGNVKFAGTAAVNWTARAPGPKHYYRCISTQC